MAWGLSSPTFWINTFKKIARLPSAFSIRYDKVRVKPMRIFPYTIHFIIASETTVIILRIFNTYQKPVD